MSRDKECSDHLRLRAAADLYNVNITVVSTLGPEGTAISPLHFNAYDRIYIDHSAEGEGEHYVSFSPQEELYKLINENFEESVDFAIAKREFNEHEQTEGKVRTLSFCFFF